VSIFVPPRPAPTVSAAAQKAGPVGQGAGVLMTEFPLLSILGGQTPQEKMRKALQIAKDAAWPEAAEDVIGMTITGQPWTLEDAEDAEVDASYPNPAAKRALALLDKPYAKIEVGRRYTRSELWRMTLRHMGLCGNSFWFLDGRDMLAGTPDSTLYIAPWRMSPNEDEKGNLLSWQLDRSPKSEGLLLELEEVIHFMLRPPDTGHFGRGLIESAIMKAQNSIGFDKHIAQVLSAGGRLSGLLSPKANETINDQQYMQLVADARTVVEQPDAAKRLQILRGPIEFTQTTMTLADLQVVELMKLARDDLLALWGVPLSQIGGATPAGLNSGETRKYDKQALWENANHPRVVMFSEAIQQGIVDPFAVLGIELEFEIEEPEFDDDSARFDLLGKSLSSPLRNKERRALVGLEPFGPSVVNPATGIALDDEVWLPVNVAMSYTAPEEGTMPQAAMPMGTPMLTVVPDMTPQNDAAQASAGESNAPPVVAKADVKPHLQGLHSSLTKLRASMDERMTPRVKDRVAVVLDEQHREVMARIRGNAAHIIANPRDTSVWWDAVKWDRKMTEALKPTLVGMAEQVQAQVANVLPPQKAGPVTAVEHVLTRGATRVTGLNNRTRDAIIATIREVVAEAVDEQLSPAVAGDRLEAALAGSTLDNGTPAFDEYRAEMIARTELMAAYNDATLGSYADGGIEMVEAIDGDEDEECIDRVARNPYTLEDADAEQDHPNGTLDWLPVIPGKAAGMRTEIEYDDEGRLKAVVEYAI
jgi:phage portal protein BeeE